MAKTNPGPAKSNTPKVFDVARPGKTPANASSKPVIVGHKPQVQDRSVTINGVGEPASLSAHKKIEVTSGTRMPPIEVPNEPDPPTHKVDPESIPEQEVEALATVAIDGVNDEVPAAPALGGSVGPQVQSRAPRQPVAPLPPDALHEEGPSPNIEAPGIVVSNHAAKPSHAGRTMLLVGIIVLLALAIFNLLLDADFLELKSIPHTDWF